MVGISLEELAMPGKRSTGIKRIAILCTILLPIVFYILEVAFPTQDERFFFVACVSIILPLLAYKIGYWVADGFQRDKQ